MPLSCQTKLDDIHNGEGVFPSSLCINGDVDANVPAACGTITSHEGISHGPWSSGCAGVNAMFFPTLFLILRAGRWMTERRVVSGWRWLWLDSLGESGGGTVERFHAHQTNPVRLGRV